MVDRPDLELDVIVDFRRDYDQRYGIFVAMVGAALIVAAGLRSRRAVLRPPARGRSAGV
jgi:hypothetical protein